VGLCAMIPRCFHRWFFGFGPMISVFSFEVGACGHLHFLACRLIIRYTSAVFRGVEL